MDQSAYEPLTGLRLKSGESNSDSHSTSPDSLSLNPEEFSPRSGTSNIYLPSANELLTRELRLLSDSVSRPSTDNIKLRPLYPTTDHVSRQPSSDTDCLPWSPSIAPDSLSKSLSTVNDCLPRLPSPPAINHLPRSPTSVTDRFPWPVPSINEYLPRPPSPDKDRLQKPSLVVFGNIVPRSGLVKTAGCRRTYAIRPRSSTYRNSSLLETLKSPNLPPETDRMGLGGNTDSLIEFYETRTQTISSELGTMPKLESPSNAALYDNTSLTGGTTQLNKHQLPVPIKTDDKEEAVSAEASAIYVDPDDKIDDVFDEVNDNREEPIARNATDEEGSGISDVVSDPEVVGKKITLVADDHLTNIEPDCTQNEALEDIINKKDSTNNDITIESESFKNQDIRAKNPSQPCLDRPQIYSTDDGASLIPKGNQQEWAVPNTDDGASLIPKGNQQEWDVPNTDDGASLIPKGNQQEWDVPNTDFGQNGGKVCPPYAATNNADTSTVAANPVSANIDVSRMSNAPEELKESWKKLIETNLQIVEMLKAQKQESNEIHDSFYKEYERLRDEVIRLSEDNGRKRYLVDDIRLKYPGMFDEDDEVRPMNEIMDQHIRIREDKIEMEVNMPNIYHQFLKDKLQIERSLGMECIGHPLKAFVDHHNEVKIGKFREEKQKLHLMDVFPMPDLMVRIDKGKSGKYPVFKILKDGQHVVMTNNGLIRAMERHKEMLEEESEDSLTDNGANDALPDEGLKKQEHSYDCGEELFYKKSDELTEQVTGTTGVNVDFENQEIIESTQGNFRLGVTAISFIQQERNDLQKMANYAELNEKAKMQNDELCLNLPSERETRGRRKTKAEEKHAKPKPREKSNGHSTPGNGGDGRNCGLQIQMTRIMPMSRNGTKNEKHVQTHRRQSSKESKYSGNNKTVLPPVVANGKYRRMADVKTALQENLKAKPHDGGTLGGLKKRSRSPVDDCKNALSSPIQNLKEVNGIKDSGSRLSKPNYTGYGDSYICTLDPHKTALDSDVSHKRYKVDKLVRDSTVAKTKAARTSVFNPPNDKKTKKMVMRMDNHDYNQKLHQLTSTISQVPESLPAIPTGCMTTIKSPNKIGIQINRKFSGNVRGMELAGSVSSAANKNIIDVNDVSALLKHCKRQ